MRTGIVAGLTGTVAMTLSEKLEQAVTGRPNSFIPAHTVERLLGLPTKPDDERRRPGWAAHWGLGTIPAACAPGPGAPGGAVGVAAPPR